MLASCVGVIAWADNAQQGGQVGAGEGEAMFASLVGLPVGCLGVMVLITAVAVLWRRRAR